MSDDKQGLIDPTRTTFEAAPCEKEFPKYNIMQHVGKRVPIAGYTEHKKTVKDKKSPTGEREIYWVKVMSEILDTDAPFELRATKIFWLKKVNEEIADPENPGQTKTVSKLAWSTDSPMAGFLRAVGVKHYRELDGNTGDKVMVQSTDPDKETGNRFLTFTW